MSHPETIEQRILDFKAFCVSNKLTIKSVCEAADINYNSVKNNMHNGIVSSSRMEALEETAIALSESNIEKQPV